MCHSNFNTIIYQTTGTRYLINRIKKTSIEWLVRKCVFCNIKREGFQCNNCQNVNKLVYFLVNPGFSLLNYYEMFKILHWNVVLLDNLYSRYSIVIPRNYAFMSYSLSTLIRHQNTTNFNHIWIKIIIIYWPSITIFDAITFTIFPKDNKAKGTFLLKKGQLLHFLSSDWRAIVCLPLANRTRS